MNKVITDGVLFMPPKFAAGLDIWSSQDGTPGSDTYDNNPNAVFVPADPDFGGCVELVKSDAVQKLRSMGETPILPGCYLQVRARVKAVSGPLPSIRIAAWAGGAGGAHVNGVVEQGPMVSLTSYGEVVEVSAIIGTGNRSGVDMVWGKEALYAHVGLDMAGTTGGVIRVDDIIVEDITSAFLRDMLASVDVRDFGAVGDGVTDDLAAFEAADAAADGRTVLVSKGTFFLGDDMTFESRVRFEGSITMADEHVFALTKNYNLPAYIDAFGDEELAFKKAVQALFDSSDHESLDMCGRRISITAPIDIRAVIGRDRYATRRHIHSGQFDVKAGDAWDTETFTGQGTYSYTNSFKLTGVTNIASIPVGSLVEGNGVGREVYVRAKNIAAQEITLSKRLYDAVGTQNFTFRRFKYVLDFTGLEDFDRFSIKDVEFRLQGEASGIILAPTGLIFSVENCFFTGPKDRGITSPGEGCQGLHVDRCQFLSNENPVPSQDRTTIALNTNGNDIKLRNNRVVKFRHFAVIGGSGSIITGNHFFQGDGESNGLRLAGIVLTGSNCRATIDGNYIDNCFIEWTNEHDDEPDFSAEYSFSQLNLSNNIFLASQVAPWFSYVVVKPHGSGHFINGLNVQGNFFRIIGGTIQRVERIDTSFSDFNYSRMKNITWRDNMYAAVDVPTVNPLVHTHSQQTESNRWVISGAPKLPFGGWVRKVESVVAEGAIRNAANIKRFDMPYVEVSKGSNNDEVYVNWDQPVRGEVVVTMRMDTPI
ncbi:glycosyl hydrolase family 28-related protein [Lentibacter sp. XHP0401]|uniref:glycosyl hydrolase family 28-related protein n=1 Tax=Lentibacter sp. XHP0401 TaxID=2984334 RepID=UPI0021E6DD61|nr:glycosyl hydrolase family 28-related protein [Lentibacter sp. XHP0401]MCV2894586.1 right-handed parallel beta-helix repeat-containing protein [Lentibacter sp. XHP0401]